jgi:crossover junction endodeoxyribonuclease RusA
MMTAYFPFPDPKLSPNARGHWAPIARVKKAYKGDCIKSLWAERIGKIDADKMHVQYTFFPPAKHGYDLDGLDSRMKYGTDAIAHVTGINDRHFTFGPPEIGGYFKPGYVRVDLTWGEA